MPFSPLVHTKTNPMCLLLLKFGHISDVFVEKNFRKLGVAKQFLKKLKKWFKNKNLKHIELSVHEKNEVGKKAWAKYGLEDYMIKKRVKMGKFNII